MAGKSTLFKTAVALAFSILVATPWAAGLSDEQEGTSRFFCVRLAQNLDYNYVIQLSQQDASYEPAQNESCFEKWYAPNEYQTAYEYIGDLLRDTSNPPGALLLTSDIDFGGYDGQTKSCIEDFKPFDYNISTPIDLLSAEGSTYTISGICYTTLSGEASFGGNLIGAIKNVKFENIRLESLNFASLFGTAVEEPDVNNVYVANAVISAPAAGLFASSTVGLYVTDFEGSSIMVRSIPDMDLSNAVNLIYPSSIEIGGLAGRVTNMYAVGISVNMLTVSNNVYIGDNAPYFVEVAAKVEAHIGGIVGHTEQVNMHRVGLEKSLVSDDASENGEFSYMGGLVGSFKYNLMVWFNSTYSFSDISCSSYKDSTYCKAGYIAGLAEFADSLYKGSNDISLVSNYHYTVADYDAASGIFGEAYCDYLREFMPNNQQGEHISCADEFNTSGALSVLEDEETLVSKTYAYGNYRSATESTPATSGFNPETYMISSMTSDDEYSVGVIDPEYMMGRAFADVLNRFNSEYGNAPVEWIADNSDERPRIASTYNDATTENSDIHVTFILDCIENSDCLTEQERAALESFYDYSNGSYTFTFDVDHSGYITNDAWLQFAYSLTESNPDRDPLYWEQGLYQPFSINNTYDYSVTYTLKKADDARDVKVYAFFGKGIDYDRTIVELISYDGEDVEEKGNEIDRANYSGGDQPVVMNVGNIMQVTARNPVTTDGSAFRGWTVLAEMVYMTDDDGLRKKAFAGVPVYVYSDGSFSFDEIGNILSERFETPEDSQYQAWKAEQEKISQEMQSYAMSGEVDEDSMSRIIARGDSISQLMDEWAENKKSTVYDDVVIVLAIYPTGFEDQNEPDDDSGNNGSDDPEKKITYPALFYSGNAIQLAVKTDKFVYEESAPFVSVLLENLNGETLYDKLFEFTDGAWPEIFTWEKYPLAPDRYLLTAKIYDGTNQNPEVRQWDFEVKAQIADSGDGEWHMVSLWNVDFDNYSWSDDGIFYWWDEFAIYGKYWQYKEFLKKDTPERGKGYWYNSLEGRSLQLKDTVYTEAMAWHFDSVNTGWNLVSNPYGWFVDIGAESNEFGKEWYDEQVKWLEEEASNREDVDEEWLREEMEWIEEERLMHQPAVEFFHWDPVAGQYEEVKTLAPYEAVWAKVNKGQEMDWELQPVPAFVATVNEDGDTVMAKSLKKKGVLAKAAGNSGWALQLVLSDAKGKMDSWNMVGVGKVAWSSEEPPAGMGDHVNLSIMDAGRRLAKSVKEQNGDAEYEWNVELTATSERVGNLKLVGIDGIRASGLRVFLTVDGSTVELNDDGGVQVRLSTTPKVANIRVAKSARPILAQNLQGLFARAAGNTLQVGFDVSEGLAGARARVDLVDMKGHVVNTASFKAESGRNEVNLEKPKGGLYILRAAAGSKIATQKVLLR